ncbi:MAG TPA: Gfo/Idh/MocA family oxidoreductase [Clostridia bacterium]|nr:Gfo/Idh/MocA family oxidoreductase [Clostridia bacterium]
MQKPMALNLAECDRMIDAAKHNGVKLKVFENFVFYPPYQLAKRMLDAGEIGAPVSMRYKMNNGGLCSANRPGVEQRVKQAAKDTGENLCATGWPVDAASWLWRLNDTLAGGGPLVFDDGYHKFSLIMHMFGAVEKVKAWIDCSPVLPGVYQDCPAMVMWKHRSGKQYGVMDIVDSPDMYVNSKYYTCDERLELTGTRGVIWVTRCTAAMMPEIAPVVMYRDGKITEYRDMSSDWADSFKNSTYDFIEAIKLDREPVLSGERGREVLKFALAAIDSSRQRREIFLDEYEDKALKKKRGALGIFGKRS